MRGSVAAGGWWLAVGGLALAALGLGAIVAASIQGMQLVPGSSFTDGYDVGLLPWMDVGTWLVPVGVIVAAIGATTAIWTGPNGRLARLASVPAVLVAAFWGFVTVFVDMAPHGSPAGASDSSSLATAVYSNPRELILLVVPAAVLIVLAASARPWRRATDRRLSAR